MTTTGAAILLSSVVALPLASVNGHGVPEEFQGKKLRVQHEQFSDGTVITGDVVTVTGELVSRQNSTIEGVSLSLFVETLVQGKAWEIVQRVPAQETFDIAAQELVPFQLKIVALRPGAYHVHTKVLIHGDNTPSMGRGQTVVASGGELGSMQEALSCSPEQELLFSGNGTAATANDSAAAGLVSEPQIAVSGSNIYVVWSDYNNTTTSNNLEVYYKKSGDGSSNSSSGNFVNFTQAVNLSNTTSDSIQPRIFANQSSVFVVWKEVTGNGEMALCKKSADYGDTFGEAIRQSQLIVAAVAVMAPRSGTNVEPAT